MKKTILLLIIALLSCHSFAKADFSFTAAEGKIYTMEDWLELRESGKQENVACPCLFNRYRGGEKKVISSENGYLWKCAGKFDKKTGNCLGVITVDAIPLQ